MRLIHTISVSGIPLAAACYLLMRCAPAPAELARQLQTPHHWIAQVGADAAVITVAGALLWLCALWLVIGLAAVWIGQLPGVAGRVGRAIAHCAVPAAIQRLVAASAGFSLLLGTASAQAVEQPAGGPGLIGVATSAVAAPGWPLDQPGPTRSEPLPAASRSVDDPKPDRSVTSSTSSRPVTAPTPDPSVPGSAGWPLDPSAGTASAGPAATAAGSRQPAQAAIDQPVRPTAPAQASSDQRPAQGGSTSPTITVRPGDSLWTIAGAELGPAATDQQIAIAWPYWYRANRPLIGRDPNLLRPGTRLSHPGAGPHGRSTGPSSQASQPIREGHRP